MCPLPDRGGNISAETFTDGNEATNATLQLPSVNVTLFDTFTEQLASALNVYYTPLLVALGTVGNLLSVFVFYNSKLRHQSTSQYLSALAISDTVFLFQLIPPWLNAVQYTGLFHKTGFCQIFVYISYVTCCLSAWLVVAFTVERFVAVVYPLRRSAVCTVTRARHVIASLVVAALVLNIPVLRFAVPSKNDCNIDYEYLDHAARFNLVDTALSFTLPLTVIILLNSWIMVGVCSLERARQQMMKEEEPAAALGDQQRTNRNQPRSQQRVTKMLLIVSTVFVLLNLPAYTMRILAYAYDMSEREYSGRWAALQQLALMFFNTNFGINFILYCLTGINFRRAVVQAIPFLRRRARRKAAERRAASAQPARASSVSTGSCVSNCTEATSNCVPSTFNYSPANGAYSVGGSCFGGPSCRYANIGAVVPGSSRGIAVSSCTAGLSYRSINSNYCVANASGKLCSIVTCIPSGNGRSGGSSGPRLNGRQVVGGNCTALRTRMPGASYCVPGPNGRRAPMGLNVASGRNFASSSYTSASARGFTRTVEIQKPGHRPAGSFIRRWTFDNSRQQRQPAIEMQEFTPRIDRL